MADKVYVMVDVRPAIAVHGELLGTRWVVTTAPTPCEFVVPRRDPRPLAEHPSGPNRGLLPPDVGEATTAINHNLQGWQREPDIDYDDPHMWGAVYQSEPAMDRVLGATVSYALAVADYDGDDDPDARWGFVEGLNAAIRQWVSAMTEWIEVLSGRIISVERTSEPYPSNTEAHPLRFDAPTGSAVGFARPPTITVSVYSESSPVTLADWTAAATQVNAALPPPLAHVLLSAARAASYVGDLRRAVIDATTACEVALSGAIRSRLWTSMPPDALDQLVGRLSGLMDLRDFHHRGLAQVRDVSRSQLDRDLAALRNCVAHAGYRPTAQEARAALDVAKRLVREIAPVDTVLLQTSPG